ncbi:MAG: gliding motility-associated C-terminal domain-containing protein [Bacteroidota bacterium]
MKISYKSFLAMIIALVLGRVGLAQTNNQTQVVNPEQWQAMKAAGTITDHTTLYDPQTETVTFSPQIYNSPNHSKSMQTNTSCNCMQQVYPLTGIDSTGFKVNPNTSGVAPLYSNDDGSAPMLTLPFTFCFYGNNYTTCWINNNGNISFGNGYGTFSPVGLQAASQKMVSPFWSDIDTRPSTSFANHPGGIVFYKLTPHALIVRWDSCGYYSQHTDKLVDFQCIISDGTDPLIEGGNNVKFCYGVMQWTTGDASQGTNGFVNTVNNVGSPAAVGASNADGINFIQFGLFGRPGNTWTNNNPPFPYDQISWLNNQSFSFSTCAGSNVPPVVQGLAYCDTLRMCPGDTLRIPISFQSPEVDQITHDTAWSTMAGFSILWDSTGNVASEEVQIVASTLNVGDNTVVFSATDNGSPAATTIITIDIFVDSFNLAKPVIQPLNPSTCPNNVVQIWVTSPPSYNFYAWNTGATTDTISAGPGIYHVTVTSPNGCRTATSDTIMPYPGSIPTITGQHQHCPGDTVLLSTGSYYSTYLWSNGATTHTIFVDTGTFTVTVQDTNGCIGSSQPFTVISSSIAPTISGNPHVCGTDTTQLNITPIFNQYHWSNGSNVSNPWVGGGIYHVTVTDTAGCVSVDSFTVNSTPNPTPSITGPRSYCGVDNTTLNGLPGGMTNYQWSDGSTTSSITASLGIYTLTVTDAQGCTGTDTAHVVQLPRPTPNISGDTAFCAYDSSILRTDSAYVSYTWSTGSTTDTIISHVTGTFTVTVTGSDGCTGVSQIFHTTANPKPVDSFSIVTPVTGRPDTIIHFYDNSFVLYGSFDSTIWNFGDGNTSLLNDPTHIYQTTGIYTVTLIIVTNAGCRDTFMYDYTINSSPIIAPNVFTPNGDGKNDLLVFENLWQYANSHIYIFNRWGNKIYDNFDYKNDWTGESHPDGTYFYILTVGDKEGTTLHGTIEIIR